MASRVQLSGPQEAEKYVLHMVSWSVIKTSCCIYSMLELLYDTGLFISAQIEDGEIYASINQKDGMVCFHDNPEKYNNPAMLHKIDQEVREWRLHFNKRL